MTTQAQNDKMFFKKLFGKIHLLSLVMTITVVIKVPNSGEPFFIKIDLERSDITLKTLSQIIQKEFKLNEDIFFLITKRPDVLIRNDNEVKKTKSRRQNRINSGRRMTLITMYTNMNHNTHDSCC